MMDGGSAHSYLLFARVKCWKMSLPVRGRPLDERHLGALLQELCQPVSVPVGEPHTAIQLCLADF